MTSVPASARETGHVAFACSASRTNVPASDAGHVADRLQRDLGDAEAAAFELLEPDLAVVRRSAGGCPASLSKLASDIVKQPASAAPISSSGLVARSTSSTAP